MVISEEEKITFTLEAKAVNANGFKFFSLYN